MDALPIKINLGIDKLVETISNATGLTARGIRKNADAESYAAIKKAETETEVQLLKLQGEDKIAQYVLARNKQKIENVEEIVSKAKQQFAPDEQVSEEPVEKDWMTRFLNIAEEVSDVDMQEIWGRVLAGEIKKPKSYSFRTLEVLRNISKEEAQLLTKASNYLIESIYLCTEDFSLPLQEQIILDDIGVVCGESLTITYSITNNEKASIVLNRQNVMNIYGPNMTKVKLRIKKLTRAGQEIMSLVQEHDYVDYYKNLSTKIKSLGAAKVTIHNITKWEGTRYTYLIEETEI